jgi:hypothetical protein
VDFAKLIDSLSPMTMKAEWFEGKAHLDIGTNTGKVHRYTHLSIRRPKKFLDITRSTHHNPRSPGRFSRTSSPRASWASTSTRS